MARKTKSGVKRKVKKSNKRVLQEFLKPRLVKNTTVKPKKKKQRVKPTYQKGKGVVLGLLGGLVPLIADLIRRA